MNNWVFYALIVSGFIAAKPAVSEGTGNATIIEILRIGTKAEAKNDAQSLMRAALALIRVGAHPAQGEIDIAEAWTAKAKALGVKTPVTPHYRGRTLGPAYKRSVIAAHGSFTTLQSVNAGEATVVSVLATKGAELGLDVHDDDNHLICHLKRDAVARSCHWVPIFTSLNAITVDNYSDFSDSYFIIIN